MRATRMRFEFQYSVCPVRPCDATLPQLTLVNILFSARHFFFFSAKRRLKLFCGLPFFSSVSWRVKIKIVLNTGSRILLDTLTVRAIQILSVVVAANMAFIFQISLRRTAFAKPMCAGIVCMISSTHCVNTSQDTLFLLPRIRRHFWLEELNSDGWNKKKKKNQTLQAKYERNIFVCCLAGAYKVYTYFFDWFLVLLQSWRNSDGDSDGKITDIGIWIYKGNSRMENIRLTL